MHTQAVSYLASAPRAALTARLHADDTGPISPVVVNSGLAPKWAIRASLAIGEAQADYDEIKSNTEQEIPSLEAVRAQIEQQLRQEAFSGLQENLRENVVITYNSQDRKPATASSEKVRQDDN